MRFQKNAKIEQDMPIEHERFNRWCSLVATITLPPGLWFAKSRGTCAWFLLVS